MVAGPTENARTCTHTGKPGGVRAGGARRRRSSACTLAREVGIPGWLPMPPERALAGPRRFRSSLALMGWHAS